MRKLCGSAAMFCSCAVLGAIGLAPTATAQESASASKSPLAVVGESTRTVALPGSGRRQGRLSVVLQNNTTDPGIVELKFFATTTGQTVQLTGGARNQSSLVRLASPTRALRLAPGDSRQVTLLFHLNRGQSLQAADGMLFARMVPPPAPTNPDPPSAIVHVFATVGSAVFSPSALTLHVTEGCPFGACGDETEATLQGPDARALLLAAPTGLAILTNGHGQTLDARVFDLTRFGNIVRARIRVTGMARWKVGTFTGKIGLGPTPDRGPSVDVTAVVGAGLVWLCLFVFAGTLFGGFFSLRWRILRRRGLLKLEVWAALDRYRQRLRWSLLQRSHENEPLEPYSYDITPLLGEEAAAEKLDVKPDEHREEGANEAPKSRDRKPAEKDADEDWARKRMEPFPAKRGAAALVWRVNTARTDADFADDVTDAHDLIDSIDRWRDVEDAAARAHEVLNQMSERDDKENVATTNEGSNTTSKAHDQPAFTDVCPKAVHDLRQLRVRAHESLLRGEASALDQAADDLVRRINRQIDVLTQFRLMWAMDNKLAKAGRWADDPNGEQEHARHKVQTLDNLSAEEERHTADGGRDGYVTFMTQVRESGDWYWAKFKEQEWEQVYQDAFGVKDLRAGRQLVNERYTNAQREGRVLSSPPEHKSRTHAKGLVTVEVSDVLWTMATAVVVVVAYALTVYGDTWGSMTDALKAFTTGFVSMSVVNWAALPAFQSIRSRWGTAKSADDKPAADKPVADKPAADVLAAAKPASKPAGSSPSDLETAVATILALLHSGAAAAGSSGNGDSGGAATKS